MLNGSSVGLRLASAEPVWLDIIPAHDDVPAVRLLVRPIGIKAVRAARAAIRVTLATDAEDMVGAGDAMSLELLRRGIVDWSGVGDAEGVPLPCNPETIELLLADPAAYEAADFAYVWPWTRRDTEKNVSAPSLDGTTAGATPASDTVTLHASGGPTAGAPEAKRPSRVRTSPTSSRPRKRKASGK